MTKARILARVTTALQVLSLTASVATFVLIASAVPGRPPSTTYVPPIRTEVFASSSPVLQPASKSDVVAIPMWRSPGFEAVRVARVFVVERSRSAVGSPHTPRSNE